MFAISRVEFAALVVPLIGALLLASVVRDGRPTRLDGVLVAAPLAVVGLVHLARRLYFGAWLPNTAIVQDRGAGSAQVLVIAAIALFALGWMVRSSSADGSRRRLGGVVLTVGALGALWLDATDRTGAPLGAFLEVPGVLPLALATWLVLGARSVLGDRAVGRHHWVLWALAAVPLSQVIVVGPARLDDFRVAGVAVVFLSLSLVVGAAEMLGDLRRGELDAELPRAIARTGTRATTSAVLAVALSIAFVGAWRGDHVRPLDYEVGWADAVILSVEQFQRNEFGGQALVITANPDLGQVSFAKRSVMVDLGWLGDPLLATLRSERPDLLDAYLGRVAVPDVVSSHSGWSCEYRGWLESRVFVADYRLVDDPRADWTRPSDACPLDGQLGIWVRTDGDAVEHEYGLVTDLIEQGDPVGVVRAAIDECDGAGGDPLRCQPVRRAVQRAAPALRDRGTFDAVVAEFERSPSAAFDRAMLRREAGWWRPAAAEVAVLLGTSS